MIGADQPTIRLDIKPAQLRLIARLMSAGMDHSLLSNDESEEAALLIGCCLDTADKPGAPDTVHGFCF